MTSTPDDDQTAPDPAPAGGVAAAPHSPLRFDGLPEPVDPARWVATQTDPAVPGSIVAGDAYTAGEVQQG